MRSGAAQEIVLFALVRFNFVHRIFKPTSTTGMSGAAPSALRSALDSSIRACADRLYYKSFSFSLKYSTSKFNCGGAVISICEPDRKKIENGGTVWFQGIFCPLCCKYRRGVICSIFLS